MANKIFSGFYLVCSLIGLNIFLSLVYIIVTAVRSSCQLSVSLLVSHDFVSQASFPQVVYQS